VWAHSTREEYILRRGLVTGTMRLSEIGMQDKSGGSSVLQWVVRGRGEGEEC
jgi:hypothetical protein